MNSLQRLYQARFGGEEAARDAIWKVLCKDFFQPMLDPASCVVDVGAGYCEFINNIDAKRRVAIDVNPDVLERAASGVEAHIASAESIPMMNEEADVVFSSNFLEHLPDKDAVQAVLKEMRRISRAGATLIILQPNIRYAYREYWDFFDHYTPLSDRSLVEALSLAGFRPMEVIPRFLPYSTKSRLPKHPSLVRLYLKFPPAWSILGKQMLIRAEAA